MLARAREAGVDAMITIGTSPDDWASYREIAGAHAGVVHYTVGLHPCSVDAEWPAGLAEAEAFWRDGMPRPAALGEIGLDRFHLPKDPAHADQIFAWQRSAFAEELKMAKRFGCPVVVHSRG